MMTVSALLRRLVLPGCLLVVAACGGSGDDPVGPAPEPLAGPTLEAEPEFTPGTTNSLHWSAPAGKTEHGWEYFAEWAEAADFAEIRDESGWTAEAEWTFAGLEHGREHHFRVRARREDGAVTDWSAPVTSIQDAAPPTVALADPGADQTSLLFDLEIAAEDPVSGVAGLELWVRVDDGDLVLHGPVPAGAYPFQTDRGGRHDFFVVATDVAGNRGEPGAAPLASTRVPEPIIIVDRRGEAFDITNAVLKHGIHQDAWEHGLGRHTIRPVIDPVMIGPGHAQYPSDDNIVEICAVTFGGDNRAYKLGDMNSIEVVDDTVAGVPIAVCY